ncbi:MAG: heme biosynthesis HemY N-terminal domain-containing protein [Burkholderiales bacterium]
MRWLIRILVLAALATGLTLLARLNEGYVLVALPGQRIELSLNFALVLLALGLVTGYLLVRLLVTAFELPGRVARFRAARRRETAHAALVEALGDFFAGRYARAEKTANRAVALGESAELGAVVAARAAHELRAPERRDRYLEQPEADPEKPDVARVITRAQMLLDERRAEEALAALAALPKKHTAALRLELRARQRLNQWDAVPSLIDQLEKRGVFSTEQAETERCHAWQQLVERQSGDAAGLAAQWRRVPERYRRVTAVAGAAAAAFHELGLCDQAQAVIERSLENEWDDGLVNLYGECSAGDARRQIEHAERWLQDHREDGTLLLALGRLCARQQLWGKAQSYLEASISVAPTYSAQFELAQLHDGLGHVDEARKHYRASLELAVGQLKRISGGRRHRPR